MRKRILSTLLALCMVLGMLPGSVWAVDYSGSFESGVTWSYSDGTLTIQGVGNMDDYSYSVDNGVTYPWSDYCKQIHTVIIGDGVTSIGDSAFNGFSGLTSVTIPNSVTRIGKYAFLKCTSLTSVTIPSSVTSIEYCAFADCSRLTNVTIPNSVTSIGSYAFDHCIGLASMTIPNSVTRIGSYAFYECRGLTSVTISSSVTSIESYTFYHCIGLTNLTISNNVTSIKYSAFSDCSKLKSVTIPNSVTSIENSSFHNCGGLTDVYYSGTETEWQSISIGSYNENLTNATIHYGIPEVYDYAITKPIGTQDSSNRYVVTGRQDETLEINGLSANFVDLYIDGQKMVRNTDYTIKNGPDTVITINLNIFKGLSKDDLHTIAAEFREGGQTTGALLGRAAQNFYLENVPINPDSPVAIISFYPADGSTFDHAAASGDKTFHITFDREVPNVSGNRPGLDFSVGTLEVHRASDDQIVYAVTESPFTAGTSSYVSLYGSSAPFTAIRIEGITPELDYDTEYYVTMPEGFVKLADGAVSPAINKGEWKFTTIGRQNATYSFSYSLDGGSWNEPDECWFYAKGDTVSITTEQPAKDGYKFKEWSDGSRAYQPGETFAMPEHDVVLTAIWEKSGEPPVSTYSFSYLLNGGTGNISEECYLYPAGEQITITSEIPLKNGTYFVGWSDGTATYQPGSTYTMPSHDVELIAQWGIGPLNLISVAHDNVIVAESYTASPRYTLADGATVVWVSADPSIATVDSRGVVTGVHYGQTTITGTATATRAMQTVSYPVAVSPNFKITFKDAFVHLAPGNSTELFFTVLPLEGKDHVILQSSDSSVISVSGNTVTAVGEGTATITAYFDPSWAAQFPCDVPGIATCSATVSNGKALAKEFAEFASQPEFKGKSRQYFITKEWDVSPDFPNNAWCAAYIIWCARMSKVNSNVIPDYKSNDLLLNAMGTMGNTYYFDDIEFVKGKEIVTESDIAKSKLPKSMDYLRNAIKIARNEFKPEVGDLAFLRWDGNVGYGPPHVGIVYEVNGTQIKIVDGNAGGQIVKFRTVSDYRSGKLGGGTLMAYARPNWNLATGVKCGTLECKFKCPIDVRFAYDGEVLDSATEQFVSSFGTMERTDDGGLLVRLNNYYDVDVTINGIGVGTMDITSTFRDSDGKTCTRKFQEVSITEDMIGKLFVYDSAATEILEIYKDKGNTFVEVWAVDGNDTVFSADEALTDWYINGDTTDDEPDNPSVLVIPTPSYPTGESTGENSGLTTITIPAFSGGIVTVNPKSAKRSTTVTLTATPDAGYELTSLTVTDNKGNKLNLTDKGNGQYTFIMPDGAVTVDAVFSVIPDKAPEDLSLPFVDVLPADWFYPSVQYVYTRGLMTGTSGTTFSPDAPMTRAMVWTVLGRMANGDVDGGTPWYAKAQAWAISAAVSDGTDPDGSITREQLVTMLHRQTGSPAATADLSGFADGGSVSDWAVPAVQWAVARGILTGDNGRLKPSAPATRAEVAALLMRFCETAAK